MGKTILRGLIGIAPIVITIAVLVWLYQKLDYFFSTPIKALIGPEYYYPGMGVIVAIIILFVAGLILNTWVAQRFSKWFEKILKRIPLLKTIYTSVTDLMSFFQTGNETKKGKIVLVEWNGMKMLGLVTRENFKDLPADFADHDEVAVFFPFSYQIGGMTAIVPRSMIKAVDMSIEKGLRFVVTAGSPSDN